MNKQLTFKSYYLQRNNRRFLRQNHPPETSAITQKYRAHHHVNIFSLAENLKHESCWDKGEMNSMILIKNEFRKELLLVLHTNTKIESVQKDQSITLHVVEGILKFKARNYTLNLLPGQFFNFNERVRYNFTSLEESTVIMTIYNFQQPN